jgi:hypothetical protein
MIAASEVRTGYPSLLLGIEASCLRGSLGAAVAWIKGDTVVFGTTSLTPQPQTSATANLAARVGFQPTVVLPTPAFEAGTLKHSATSPFFQRSKLPKTKTPVPFWVPGWVTLVTWYFSLHPGSCVSFGKLPIHLYGFMLRQTSHGRARTQPIRP